MIKAQIPKKLDYLFRPHRYKVARGGRGSAKCLGPGTPVLMFDGSIKKVEDVVVGDKVMGPDSSERVVLSTTTGISNMYEVKQTSAMTYFINDEHILSLKKSKSCGKDVGVSSAGNPRRPRGRYPDWPDTTNISVKNYLSQSIRWRENFRGYRAGLIDFPEQPVPVDPYLLGLWLGDGLHREMMITSADKEIVDWLSDFCFKNKAKLTTSAKSGKSDKAHDYRIVKKEGRVNPIWAGFKELGVVSNKHIPQCYISNSKDVRLKLLAGLIDTDGSYSTHGYTIVSAKEDLAFGIKRLVDSLGFRTSIKKKTTSCGDFHGVAWRISINGDVWDIPCQIERKKYKHNGTLPNKDKTLSYLKVTPVGEGRYYGFAVNGDNLFCLGDGTVTHNSWSFARALLIIGASKPRRVLCTREVQMSIKQSVHKLLSDQIQLLGLESIYTVQYDKIIGANGTEFTFSGLSSLTADTIKSFEGYDVCWVEEGQAISKRSWDILIPTIRKEGSEIWVSYNPDLESDETHQRFCINPPADCINVEINWRDNPWFSDVLNRERLHCQQTDPDSYDHIWEGKCRSAVEGAIYFKQIQDAETNRHICNIPNDPMLKTHIVLDLGWEDSLAVGLVQKHLSEIRIVEYLEAYQTTIPTLFREIETRGHNWGKVFLPHDGFAKTLAGNGNSTADIITALGWKVQPKDETITATVEEGIRQTRLSFHQIYFDLENAAATERPEESKIPGFHHTNYSHRLVEVLKRYQRKVSRQTGSVGAPVHNEFSHGADMMRYLVLNKDHMVNEVQGINRDLLRGRRRGKQGGWMAA